VRCAGSERDVEWPYAYFELAQRDLQPDGRRYEGFFSSQVPSLHTPGHAPAHPCHPPPARHSRAKQLVNPPCEQPAVGLALPACLLACLLVCLPAC
jgi:hypothetical protein